jgi:hypothetical protein
MHASADRRSCNRGDTRLTLRPGRPGDSPLALGPAGQDEGEGAREEEEWEAGVLSSRTQFADHLAVRRAAFGPVYPNCCRGGVCGKRWRRPSRPGEFHPEPLTDPDLTLSRHPARVIARRLSPSAEPSGSSRYDPVDPSSTAMTHPLRSTGITPLHHYYEAVRPSPAHRYFRPRGWSRLCLFPWHRRPGSHVPYKSQIELRAVYMPDAAWAVSGHPPS